MGLRPRPQIAAWFATAIAVISVTGSLLYYFARTRAPISVAHPEFAPRLVPEWRAIAGRDSTTPNAASPASLVVFVDLQCGPCKVMSAVLDSVKTVLGEGVTVRYRHLPIVSTHPQAERAAVAWVCASDQNRHDEFERAAFSRSEVVAAEGWGELARTAEVPDSALFFLCLQSGRAADIVAADVKIAQQHRIGATPAILANDSLFFGSMPFARVMALLEPRLR